MRIRYRILLLLAVVLLPSCVEKPTLGKVPVVKILKAMTLSEKASMLVVADNGDSVLVTTGIERFAIPSVTLATCNVTGLPDLVSMERTWNLELAGKLGEYMAHETNVACAGRIHSVLFRLDEVDTIALSRQFAGAIVKGIDASGSSAAVFHHAVLDTVLKSQFGPDVLTIAHCDNNDQIIPALSAGNDMVVGTNGSVADTIVAAVHDGRLNITDLDRKLVGILEYLATIETDNDGPSDKDEHSSLLDEYSGQSAVLLKNNAALPLGRNPGSISLYGLSAYNPSLSLDRALLEAGFRLEPSVASMYRRFPSSESDSLVPDALIRKPFQLRADAIASQIAVVVLGRESDVEPDLVRNVCDAFHFKSRKVVLVVLDECAMKPVRDANMADALVVASQTGSRTAKTVSQILSGKLNPSGRLARTMPQVPQYGFGNGIGFTSFSYTRPDVRASGNKLIATVHVTNTGLYPGMDVMAVSLLHGQVDGKRSLMTFAKTRILSPGESQSLEFPVTGPITADESRIEFSTADGLNAVSTFIPIIQ